MFCPVVSCKCKKWNGVDPRRGIIVTSACTAMLFSYTAPIYLAIRHRDMRPFFKSYQNVWTAPQLACKVIISKGRRGAYAFNFFNTFTLCATTDYYIS